MTKKAKPRDAMKAIDTLNLHLSQAKGIVYAVAQASMRVDKDFCHALESAFTHLETAKEAADNLWDAHNAAKVEGGAP